MKNLLIGFIFGVVLVFSIGAVTRSSKYQSTLCNQTGSSSYLYVVLNTQTGETRAVLLDAAPRTIGAPTNNPPLVLKIGTINADGNGKWHYAHI